MKTGEVDITSKYVSLKEQDIDGDFRFVVIEKVLSNSFGLSFWERSIIMVHQQMKRLVSNEQKKLGTDNTLA